MVIIKKMGEVRWERVSDPNARSVKVKWVFGPRDNVPNFYFRIFELAPGGRTPFHSHPYEHVVFVLEGEVVLKTRKGEISLTPRETAYIPPNEHHGFKNVKREIPARFICIIPADYRERSSSKASSSGERGSNQREGV